MSSVARQALCTSIVCVLSLSVGLILTWPSSTYEIFKSTNTTLHRPMTETELSLFGSLSSFGALVSTPVAGLVMDTLGRKYSTIAASMTHVIAWSLITFSNRVEVILASVFLSGLGGVVFLVVPLYIAEFCEESIRGTMSSMTFVIYSLGILISHLMGGLLTYFQMIYVSLSISIAGMLLLNVLKESPVLLMQKGLENEAVKAISFYRNIKIDSKEMFEAIAAIRRTLSAEADGGSEEEKKLNPKEVNKEKVSIWTFLKKSRSTRNAIFVTLFLCTVSFFQGLVVVLVYAEPLFSEVVPNISSTLCTVILAIFNIVAGLGTGYLIEAAGRKSLMIYSSIVSGICCVMLGSQLQFNWGPNMLTAILIYIFCMSYNCGAGTVPYVVIAEIFLPEIRSFASTLLNEYCWLCNFVVLFVFNPLVTAIGLGPVFYIFSFFCFVTPIFCYFWMPETKGLPVDSIQILFAPKRWRVTA